MTFINEYIANEDRVQYGIASLDQKYVVGGTRSRQWTIDRNRDIYLRQVAVGKEDAAGLTVWTLYWRGDLIEVRVEVIKVTGGVGQPCVAHMRIRDLPLPPNLAIRRAEIIADLEEALLAYKDGGVYSACTEYRLVLDVQ